MTNRSKSHWTWNSIKRYKAQNKDIKTWYFAIMLYPMLFYVVGMRLMPLVIGNVVLEWKRKKQMLIHMTLVSSIMLLVPFSVRNFWTKFTKKKYHLTSNIYFHSKITKIFLLFKLCFFFVQTWSIIHQ